MASGALPVTIVVLVAAVAVVAWRRPRLPVAAAPVLAICVGGLLLVGWPMLELGFRSITNANDDMANYVLLATQLLQHGLLGPLDVQGLSQDTNYAAATQSLHNAGARPRCRHHARRAVGCDGPRTVRSLHAAHHLVQPHDGLRSRCTGDAGREAVVGGLARRVPLGGLAAGGVRGCPAAPFPGLGTGARCSAVRAPHAAGAAVGDEEPTGASSS